MKALKVLIVVMALVVAVAAVSGGTGAVDAPHNLECPPGHTPVLVNGAPGCTHPQWGLDFHISASWQLHEGTHSSQTGQQQPTATPTAQPTTTPSDVPEPPCQDGFREVVLEGFDPWCTRIIPDDEPPCAGDYTLIQSFDDNGVGTLSCVQDYEPKCPEGMFLLDIGGLSICWPNDVDSEIIMCADGSTVVRPAVPPGLDNKLACPEDE